MNEGSCNCYPLFLAAGEGASLLTHRGIEAKGHVGEVSGQSAVLEGFLQLLFCKGLAQCDVVADRRVEKEYVLGNVAHLFLQLFRGVVCCVPAVEADGTIIVREPA